MKVSAYWIIYKQNTQECSKAMVDLLSFYWIKVSQFRFMFVFCIYIYIYIYNSKSLDVVQSLYFGNKLPSSGAYNNVQ